MQHNAPFCVLLKKKHFWGGENPPRPNPPTAFSLSRVGMHAVCKYKQYTNILMYNTFPVSWLYDNKCIQKINYRPVFLIMKMWA